MNQTSQKPISLEDIRTPAFIIDLPKLKRNAAMMQERAKELGVRLRPHVKTHKTLDAAAIQTEGGFDGIAVSTLAEVEFFKAAGFEDITYAFPIAESKLSAVHKLQEGIKLHIMVDHPEQIRAIERYSRDTRARFSVLLKVDTGYGRAGVAWHLPYAVTVAKRLRRCRWVDFEGIYSHSGHSYEAPNLPKVDKIHRQEVNNMNRFADKLEEEGILCPTVSVGSTPTCVNAEGPMEGVTEIHPGNYLFLDKTQADIETCELEDVAATVLTTIVSHYKDRNQLLIDAGALALSKDRGAEHRNAETLYGAVEGYNFFKIFKLSQEHGMITAKSKIDIRQFPIGSRLRIIPNHSCLTAACFPEYHVFEDDILQEIWRPVRGW